MNLLLFQLKHIGRPLNLLVEETDKRPERNTGFFLGVMCNIQIS